MLPSLLQYRHTISPFSSPSLSLSRYLPLSHTLSNTPSFISSLLISHHSPAMGGSRELRTGVPELRGVATPGPTPGRCCALCKTGLTRTGGRYRKSRDYSV